MRGGLPPLCRELPPYGRLAGTQERQTLLLPGHRQPPLELLQHERLIRRLFENSLDDVRRQQGQPQDPADIALVDRFGFVAGVSWLPSGATICS
jgi:hypothetical protein